MKKLLSLLLTSSVLLILPSLAMAKGDKDKLEFGGTVTAVTETSITVSHGKTGGGKTETITVPVGTPIKDDSGADLPLSGLVGKHVKIEESNAETASSILVTAHKGGKKTPA